MAANCLGLDPLPVKHGSCAKAVPGFDLRVLDESGKETPAEVTGAVVAKLPLPPGCLPTLWNNDEGFLKSYLERYPGYYLTADAGYRDKEGYLFIMSRMDDIINVAGHRLSTGGMEEILAGHPDVAECAVIGVKDELKGQIPLGFVVLKAPGPRHAGPRGRLQESLCRVPVAEDTLRKDPAWHDAQDCRLRTIPYTPYPGRSGYPARHRSSSAGAGLRERGSIRRSADNLGCRSAHGVAPGPEFADYESARSPDQPMTIHMYRIRLPGCILN
jgi:propionyl-CoA synthetase